MEKNNKSIIRLAVISLTVIIILIGYFTIIKDFESRLVKLETRFEQLQNIDSNNQSSIK
jgi:hypothetical protein